MRLASRVEPRSPGRACSPARLRLVGLALLLLFGFVLPDRTHAASAANLLVANITDQSFSVTWTTDVATRGQVRLTTGEVISEAPYPDGRGPDFAGRTHFVLVRALQPNKAYAFDLLSGADVDDNGGAHYTVTTGPTLTPAGTPDSFIGSVNNSDGTDAGDAYVLLRIQSGSPGTPVESQWLAAPVAPDPKTYFGQFSLTLRAWPRAADGKTYLQYNKTADKVALLARGATGSFSGTVDVTAPRYGKSFTINLAGTASTATPTSNVPTATRTLTRTATPVPTAVGTPTVTPTDESDIPTRPPTATRPRLTNTPAPPPTSVPATEIPTALPASTLAPGTDTPKPTQIAAALPTRPAPPAVETRSAATVAERLAGPTLFIVVALLAFGFAALFISLAVYFWRRQA